MVTGLREKVPPESWTEHLDLRFTDIDRRFAVFEQRWRVELAEESAKIRAEMREGFERVDAHFIEIHKELGQLRGEFATQTRTLFFGMFGLIISVCLLALAASQLLG